MSNNKILNQHHYNGEPWSSRFYSKVLSRNPREQSINGLLKSKGQAFVNTQELLHKKFISSSIAYLQWLAFSFNAWHCAFYGEISQELYHLLNQVPKDLSNSRRALLESHFQMLEIRHGEQINVYASSQWQNVDKFMPDSYQNCVTDLAFTKQFYLSPPEFLAKTRCESSFGAFHKQRPAYAMYAGYWRVWLWYWLTSPDNAGKITCPEQIKNSLMHDNPQLKMISIKDFEYEFVAFMLTHRHDSKLGFLEYTYVAPEPVLEIPEEGEVDIYTKEAQDSLLAFSAASTSLTLFTTPVLADDPDRKTSKTQEKHAIDNEKRIERSLANIMKLRATYLALVPYFKAKRVDKVKELEKIKEAYPKEYEFYMCVLKQPGYFVR